MLDVQFDQSNAPDPESNYEIDQYSWAGDETLTSTSSSPTDSCGEILVPVKSGSAFVDEPPQSSPTAFSQRLSEINVEHLPPIKEDTTGQHYGGYEATNHSLPGSFTESSSPSSTNSPSQSSDVYPEEDILKNVSKPLSKQSEAQSGIWQSTKTGLRYTWVMFRFYLVRTLPFLLPVMFHLAVLALAFLFFWLMAFQGLRIGCTQGGLSIFSQLSSSVFRTGDFCTPFYMTPKKSAAEVLGNDPTGIMRMTDLVNTTRGLVAAKEAISGMRYNVAMLVVNTEIWQDSIIDGPVIHNMAVNYSASYKVAAHEIRRMHTNHTVFIGSIAFDVRLLSNNVNHTLSAYGGWSYLFSNLCYSWLYPRYSPRGRMHHDFLAFARFQGRRMAQLVEQSTNLLTDLETMMDRRNKIEEYVRATEVRWAEKCMGKKSNGHLGFGAKHDAVVGKDQLCQQYNFRRMQQIREQGLGHSFEAIRLSAETQLKAYKRLSNDYTRLAAELESGEAAPQKYESMTFQSY